MPYYGIKLENNKPVKIFTIAAEGICNNNDEYIKLIELNLANMRKNGIKIERHSSKDNRFDKVLVSFDKTKMLQYYMLINKRLVCASIEINEINDIWNNFLDDMVSSIEIF